MTISTQDLRRLLDGDEDSALVLVEGRVEVITADQKSDEAFRGALEVISRSELLDRVGSRSSEDRLEAQAAALDTAVNELGG
ncbi:hypothetical protein [Mycolicibacterium gilvum]|uniref:FAD-dependent pyridine nucleotide-disulfide oxidoreductase n=1 Tax=Mycolicibacterium gilvum TaxID=1804 RepID=A0A378SNI6_9MYCO|nr:hypothetical protein [Mycolicibacterium gilvum]MCV7056777.1 hypothetical protein [Mycolicibacterium gilvum]STZ43925.1 FAD-dependent pyridine nucleotide-disulfide oxidoreductase [Mycolicibacterium gilvum]